MNKSDRGAIKWTPFNSIVNQRQMIDNLIKEKNKITKPKLSQEQIEKNEQLLIEAFYEQIQVNIDYFKEGFILSTCSEISSIDYTFKKIYLKNNKSLLFSQIIKVSTL